MSTSNSPYPPSFERPPQSGNDWAAPLIVACLALGFTISWGTYELKYRVHEAAAVSAYRHDLDFERACDSDLGKLLADPRTTLTRLKDVYSTDPGVSDLEEPIRSAVVAWNQDREQGVLFCPELKPPASGTSYQVWILPQDGGPIPITLENVQPGKTVFAFTAPDSSLPAHGFALTLGRPASMLERAGQILARSG